MSINHITEHFSLDELTRSELALRHNISNMPGKDEVINLTRFAKYILEPVRQHFNIPFRPSSGYRSPEVNRLAGSKPTSQHLTGQAADFEIPPIANLDLASWIKANLIFDQLILEFHNIDDPRSGWVHCSYVSNQNRNKCLIYDGNNYREF